MQVPRKRPDVGTSRKKLTGGGSLQNGVTPKKARKLRAGLLALVVALAMVVAIPGFAQGIGDAVSNIVNGGASTFAVTSNSTRLADGDTKGLVDSSLGSSSSTRYNGRVWVDKSVSADQSISFTGSNLTGGSVTVQNDSDFLVTYSALATSTQIMGESQVPVDVVFVIDNSNSMDDSVGGGSQQTRLEATVEAVNASIGQVMDSHPDSRVAVVIYGGQAETLLPLGHYERMGDGSYITLSSRYIPGGWFESSGYRTTFRASGNHSVTMDPGDRGTNTHMGVDAGMDILRSATNIGDGANKHVPALILLSDGASTYSGDGNWWNPSGSQGNGRDTNNAHALKVAMNAQYNKQLVNEHYGVSDSSSSYACRVYTIGMGIEQLSNENENNYHRAQIALDPGEHLTDNNGVANTIENAWNQYQQTYYNTPTLDGYTFSHPNSNDIDTIAYNDGYYSAENAEDVANVFDDITSTIVSSRPTVPTEVTGDDPTQDGYITYTDEIGQYMEVKDVKTLIWSNTAFYNAGKSIKGNVTTYTFSGNINSPVYGKHNADEIIITVTDNDDYTQTLEVKIPASAIPVRVNTVTLGENDTVTSNVSNGAMPLHLCYTIGLAEGIDPTVLEQVSADYINANLEDGKVNFYSNAYTPEVRAEDGTVQAPENIGAQVTFTPADNNPFYFFTENTPIYNDVDGNNQAQSFDVNGTYFVPVTYYDGITSETTYVARSGSVLQDWVASSEEMGGYYIEQYAPRIGNLEEVTADKAEGNNLTNTAATYRRPTFVGSDVQEGHFVVYLGNNGKMQLDAPASLTIEKNVTAETGLTAPADATFTFQLTIPAYKNSSVNAVLHTDGAADQPVSLAFDENGLAQVQGAGDAVTPIQLKANQSLEIPGMVNKDYTVQETDCPDGFLLAQENGIAVNNDAAQISTDEMSVEANVGTDSDNVVYTNHYSVTPATSDDLNIDFEGTKTIDTRDFQAGDSFTFTIAAAQATPTAPLPTEDSDGDGSPTTVTIEPTSGKSASFAFDGVTFDKPGEYRYIISEVDPTNDGDDQTTGLGGVDYDPAIFRINIVVVDNGDGTLRLATTDEINSGQAGAINGNIQYTSNPMIQEYVGGSMVAANAVQFENHYSAETTTASIQGTKVLEVTNSDYVLEDGDFLFNIEALGSNTDGRDIFAQDDTQPVPVATQVQNIANGNVTFRFAPGAFNQTMVGKTYGYRITEAPGDVMGNVVYDSNTSRIVKIAVTDDGDGHVVATVTPNDPQQGAQNNFTFTNTYKPTPTVIGTDTQAGIRVQKTFTGHAWTADYTFKYTISAVSNTAGLVEDDMPMPASETLEVSNPAAGAVNTNAFGQMTFERAGNYVYNITETDSGNDGITDDNHIATVTVAVTENSEKGALSADVTYDNRNALNDADRNTSDAAAFTNTYSAAFDDETAVTISGAKQMDVADGFGYTLHDGSFYFDVTPIDGAPTVSTPVSNTNSSQVESTNDWTSDIAIISNLGFTLDQLQGQASKTFSYVVTERAGSQPSVGYDTTAYRIDITVTDDGNGRLYVAGTDIVKGSMVDGSFVADAEGSDAEDVVFKNTYAPTATTVTPLAITKVMSGADLSAGVFTFTMSLVSADPEDGVTLPGRPYAANNAQGAVQFGDIAFSKPGTYVIEVTEDIPASATNPDVEGGQVAYKDATDEQKAENGWTLDGVTYDSHAVRTTFTVHDVNGVLRVNRTSTTGSHTFQNSYGATGEFDPDSITPAVNKVVAGNGSDDEMSPASYTFNLSVVNTTNEDPTFGFTIADPTAESDGNGAVDFDNITFSAPGTYEVTISENVPAEGDASYDSHVTYDGHQLTYTVNVEDRDENGTLTATVDESTISAGESTFTNIYTDEQEKTVSSTDGDGNPTADIDGQLVGVGDILTYQVKWVNNALDDNRAPTSATVIVTDTIPSGTRLVEGSIDNGGSLNNEGQIVWTFNDQPAGKTGVVSFQVEVTDDAVEYDSISNSATINIGGTSHNTNTVTNTVPKKTVEAPQGGLQVGSVLDYTITYANTSDKNAKVVVTDELPDGLTVIEDSISEGGSYSSDDHTITWTFDSVAANTGGEVSFSARVNENASVVDDPTTNSATVSVGNNSYNTNTTDNGGTQSGDLAISKQVVVDEEQGTEIDADKAFTFTIAMKDANGNPLTGTYEVRGIEGVDSLSFAATDTKDAGTATIDLKHDQTATIVGLPEGASYQVTEADYSKDGYTTQVPENANGTITADLATVNFVNSYEAGGVTPGTGDASADTQLTKVVAGRDWLDGETFKFILTADEGTPEETLPEQTTVEVGKPDEGNSATFAFGPFSFNKVGEYHYTVTEDQGGTTSNGMSYSRNTAEITISVYDNGTGKLGATVSIENPVFTNTYSSELDYDAAGGLSIVKNLDGHAIAAGQFEFTVKAADQASADKANITDGLTKTFDSTAAAMEFGVAHNTFGLDFNIFTQEDVDHTYTYTVSETKGGDTDAGYTNDGTVYTVTIKTADSNDGVLTVTTTVSAPGMEDQVYTYTNNAQSTGKAQVVFNNAYDANGTIDDDGEGSVDINATKELVNGVLEGGEFTFVVTDANGETVTTGTNAADGTIDFEQIEYTTDKLVADAFGENPTASYDADTNTYTYEYQVAEDVSSLPDGVTANTNPFQIKVSVTDNNDGTLSFKVLYPENSGDSLAFKNTYGTVEDGSAELAVAGIKKLDMAEGLTGPDITGKYTFTLTGSEGAPMPDKAEATNDSAGNVTFGTIEYTIENVFGSATADEPATDEADGTTTDENAGIDTQIAQREKTFTYEVTESGNVAGVANDPNSTRTFTVTVIDNGDGTISLTDGDGNAIQGGLSFEFTNTYSVEPETSTPTGEGGITITKKLEGDRPMNAGEFAFVMVDVTTDAEVASGTNDENGNVELGGIEFTKPGTYQYKLYEAVGDLGGITYDRAQYIATATVTDDHDGTLSVTWTVTPADGTEPVDGLTFTNTYAPTDPGSIVFGASKVLNGDRELVEGEFTFELKNADGEVLQTATNNADGSVVFSDPVEFDKAGEYTFTVSERLPEDDDPSAEGIQKDGVTYDETVYTATVNVADVDENGVYDGVLTASVSYGNDGKLPSFTNTYVKPAEPAPEEPTDAMPKTGDTSNVAVIGLGLAAMALVAGGVVLRRRTNR